MKTLSDAVQSAKELNRLVSVDDAVDGLPNWEAIYAMFTKSLNTDNMQAYNFATAAIDKGHKIGSELDDLIDIASEAHGGKFASTLTIIHFLNATDNEIPEEAKEFYSSFRENCPEHVPEGFEAFMIPVRHSDPIDGIYIQCLGNTFWTAYYDDHVEKFALKPGDMIIIPKGVEHSVESLTPRVGVSIAMAD
tara:strand:- start:1140 stop:1715 length:576 start_codon:yes stop_codon:yes gene_type:complete